MKYVAVSLVISALIASLSIWYWKTENPKNESEFTGNFGTSNPQFRNTDTKNLSPYAMFGDSSLVMMTKEEKNGKHFIDIPYDEKSSDIKWIRFEPRLGVVSFLDKERREIGQIILKPEALARFLSTDPRADKYPELSPYNFVAGNPITNIDPNGDTIVVVVSTSSVDANGKQALQQNKYYYGEGTNGIFGFFDNEGNLYNGNNQFITEVTKALDNLRQGGIVGKELINYLITHTNTTQIAQMSRNNAETETGAYVLWNPKGKVAAPDQTGSVERPAYIGLGHELAHIKDVWQGTINLETWKAVPLPNGGTKDIPKAEIYATHVENQLRAENGIPLRVSYGVGLNNSIDNTTRLLKGNTNNSLYYNQNGQTNYKRLRKKQTPFKY